MTLLQSWSTNWMAGGGSPNYNGDAKGYINVYLVSQDVNSNSSYIKIDHYAVLTTSISGGDVEVRYCTSSYRANNGSFGGTYQTVSGNQSRTNMTAGYQYYNWVGSTYHTVYHNSDGSAQLYVNGSIYGALYGFYGAIGEYTKTSSFNIALPNLLKPSVMTSTIYNGNTDTSLNVTATAPSSGQCDIFIELINDTKDAVIGNPIRHYNTTNTTFTVSEMLSLANYIPDRNTCNFRITASTMVNGVEVHYDYHDGTYSVINANPTFSNFTYLDSDSAITTLTGNNQTIVKGYSNLQATVSTANKAVAIKGATMSYYQLVVGAKQTTATYSSTANVILSISDISSNVFSLYAVDSRGNSTLIQKSPTTYIDYFSPIISSSTATRDNGIDTDTLLAFNGTFFNSSFGSTNNNISVSYKYKITSASTYTNGTTNIIPTKVGNAYSFSGYIAGDEGANGFSNLNSYNLVLTVVDSLVTTTYSFILGTGSPNIAIHKDGIAIGSAYSTSIGGSLQVNSKSFLDNIYPVGSIYMNYTSSTSPATRFGGTWVQLTDRVLVGAGGSYSAGSTGGATTHTLTESEMPSHRHNVVVDGTTMQLRSGGASGTTWRAVSLDGTQNGTTYANNTGGGQAHNNLQPYRAVYQWYRSA